MARHIGHYLLTERLTPGGMGQVWRGHDTRDGTAVAVKEPALDGCADFAQRMRLLQRFDRECRALARLDHPNVVRVREALVCDSRPYIVMEYVEGEALDRALARPHSPAAGVAVVRQLLDAAGHAHERGIVHRDIKPGNAFLLPDGVVKLADFGIARLAEETATVTMTVVASAAYLSPEQARGEPVDARSDLFSIGILAYEALTGTHPFRRADDHPMATVFRIVNDPHAPAGTLRPGIGDALSAVVDRALAKDPSDRFGSAAEMRAALDRAAPDELAQRAALVSLAREAPPTAPRSDPGESPTLLMPSPAPTRVMPPPPPAARPAASAAPPLEPLPAADGAETRSRRRWPLVVAVSLALLLALALGAYHLFAPRPAPRTREPQTVELPREVIPVDPVAPEPPTTPIDPQPKDTSAIESAPAVPEEDSSTRADIPAGESSTGSASTPDKSPGPAVDAPEVEAPVEDEPAAQPEAPAPEPAPPAQTPSDSPEP